VFEGGGAKGLAFVGARKLSSGTAHTGRLIRSSRLDHSLLIAAGYSSQENLAAISEKCQTAAPLCRLYGRTDTL
jgi:hypothetical protein